MFAAENANGSCDIELKIKGRSRRNGKIFDFHFSTPLKNVKNGERCGIMNYSKCYVRKKGHCSVYAYDKWMLLSGMCLMRNTLPGIKAAEQSAAVLFIE
jgi:hypothetical protein